MIVENNHLVVTLNEIRSNGRSKGNLILKKLKRCLFVITSTPYIFNTAKTIKYKKIKY